MKSQKLKINDNEKKIDDDKENKNYTDQSMKDITKSYKHEVLNLENEVKQLIKDQKTAISEKVVPYYDIIITSKYIELTNIHLKIYDVLILDSRLKLKSEKYLVKAKKFFFNGILQLEKIFGFNLSISDSIDNKKFLKLNKLHIKRLFIFINKINNCLNKITLLFNENKYKWNILEFKARLSIVFKYMINLRNINNINHPEYSFLARIVNVYKQYIENVSDMYREKYFTLTKKPFDMQVAIAFQEELRRLYFYMEDKEMIDTIVKKVDMWRNMLNKEESRRKYKRKIK